MARLHADLLTKILFSRQMYRVFLCSPKASPHQRRMVEDTDKRQEGDDHDALDVCMRLTPVLHCAFQSTSLSSLFQRVESGDLNEDIIALLVELAEGTAGRMLITALAIVCAISLTTSSSLLHQ